MVAPLPFSQSYNLARLGQTGDEVVITADADQRAAIAAWSEVLSLESFTVRISLSTLAPAQFGLDCVLTADVTQACVVTLEPVPAHIEHRFHRELHFNGPSRRKPANDKVGGESTPDLVIGTEEEEGPEVIDSLHYDLAGPVLEEYVLALEPYPRCPGAEFAPKTTDSDPPSNPFAVLKGLK
jgi:uncharacterized metal-binding protein YceD (DUF177 family)